MIKTSRSFIAGLCSFNALLLKVSLKIFEIVFDSMETGTHLKKRGKSDGSIPTSAFQLRNMLKSCPD
jgi:hypothetical protein